MRDANPSSSDRKPVVSVVDDDAAMRAALIDLLDSAGCQSSGFKSGEHFISSGAAKTSDLIITDVQMKEMNGLELLERLKEDLCPDVPVIVISALTDEGLEKRAFTRGCYAFMRKPFNPDTLLGYVKDAVASPR